MFTKVIKKINSEVTNRRNEPLNDIKHKSQRKWKKSVVNANSRTQNASTVRPFSIVEAEEEKICRICRLRETKTREELISPCACKGTLAYIHQTCLEVWLKRSGTTYCELCRFNYTVKIIQRYSRINSIRKWLTDEENSDVIQDLIVDLVLVITFLPIVFICAYGFTSVCYEIPRVQKYYFSHNSLEAKQNLGMLFVLGCASITIIVSYTVWILLRFTYYRKKWSNWTRRHGKLLLVLNKR